MSRLVNPALLAHFLRRFWPFMAVLAAWLAVQAAGLASFLGVTYALSSAAGATVSPASALRFVCASVAPGLCPVAAVMCLVAALLCFRHLRDRSELQYYLGAPLSRPCLFATAHVAALLLVALPVAAVLAVAALLELAGGLAEALPWLGVLAGVALCALLMFGGLASLACVVTGRLGGAVLVYLCLNVAAISVYGSSASVLQSFLVGVPLDSGGALDAVLWLTPVAKMMQAAMPAYHVGDAWGVGVSGDMAVIGVYALLGAGIAVAAGALYRARPAEAAGETIAFVGARVAFQVLASLVVAALATLFVGFRSLFSSSGVDAAGYAAALLVFAALGWVASEMVVRRSSRVFDGRTLGGGGALVAALAVVLVLLAADVFGVVRWVPDVGDVEAAELTYLGEGGEVDPADAVAVHRAVLENRDLLVAGAGGASSAALKIAYDMADGSRVERAYRLARDWGSDDEDAIEAAAKEALSTPDAVHASAFGVSRELAFDEVREANYWLYDDRLGTGRPDGAWAPFSRMQAYELYCAVRRDMEAGNVSWFGADGDAAMGYIDFDLDIAGDGDGGVGGDGSAGVAVTIGHVEITEDMENTVAWIRDFELGAVWQERPDDAGGAL